MGRRYRAYIRWYFIYTQVPELCTPLKYMESKYLSLSEWERQKRRRQRKANYLYVRYADDFVVLCNGTKAEALAIKEELEELLSTMGLTLSEEKTKVTHITDGFDFLGYRVIRR